MPYRSERQRRYMHARHPAIAARWDKQYGGKIVTASPAPAVKAIRKRMRQR